MKTIVKITALLLFFGMANIVEAQKFGYLDSQSILAQMSEVKMMKSELESLSTILQKEGEQKLKEYQAQEQDAIQKKERRELSPVQEEAVIQELQAKQQNLMKFEQEMQQRLVKKEQELLEPILAKINDAISAVATENGFTYIFDASTGIILYADETSNVADLVKGKLNL